MENEGNELNEKEEREMVLGGCYSHQQGLPFGPQSVPHPPAVWPV